MANTAKKDNVIVIRGISDNADSDKSRLEKNTKGLARKCAATNAALYLKYQLQSDRFVRAVKELQNPGLPLARNIGDQTGPTDILEDTIRKVSEEIDERLNELSPEYRLKPRGYVLPAPRFRRLPLKSVDMGREYYPAQSFSEILSESRITWVKLDPTYPDDSLPWVLAQSVIRQESGDSLRLPIVIEGSHIRPPNGTFEKLLQEYNLEGLRQRHNCEAVVIIPDPNLSTENTRRFLSSQIEEHPGLNFVVISRDEFRLTDLGSSFDGGAGRLYAVDKVSFQELAFFLQTAFQMEPQKAEVLAGKLDAVFSRFDLFAHPTYFAGIPETMLNAFLQANRRSELIQLAVDGFLTFLVADDPADVILSRTTRQQFLRRLVYQTRVELERPSKLALVSIADKFAVEMDYDIDPTSFVDDFFKKGILKENGDVAEFALPFVESYLLALEMRERSSLEQKRYFDFDLDSVDVATFDLFCELADSNPLIEVVADRVQESIASLDDLYQGTNVLLSQDVRPKAAFRPNITERLLETIKSAEDDVRRGRSSAADKQAMLDMVAEALKVAEHRRAAEQGAAGEADPDVGHQSDEDEREAIEIKRRATRSFFVACLALGAGAERLNAKTKQELITKLFGLGARIANGWTRDRLEVSLDDIESDLRNSSTHQRAMEESSNDSDREGLEKFVTQLAELLEFRMLDEPLQWVLYIMTEYGRHRVLAQSIESVSSDDLNSDFERILREVWLTELKTADGIKQLRRAIRDAKPGDFFRLSFANYLLLGVEWNHWRKSDRLQLLDLATEIVQPTNLRLNKGRMKRQIEQQAPKNS